MILSPKNKFIYFKATKVAGTSTEILLSDFCEDSAIVTPISIEKTNSHRPRNHEELGFYNHIKPLEVRNKLGASFDSYFKFITARNPFDRIVSAFWWYRNTQPCSFEEFVSKKMGDASLHVPLLEFCSIENDVIVDDFIRYENLEQDTLRIFKKWFNVDSLAYPTAKSSQRKSSAHYSEYYTNETRSIITERYAKDIDYFGYEFEGSTNTAAKVSITSGDTLKGISKAFYINLDRRKDRKQHIENTLPFPADRVRAVDASTLELTPEIRQLFPSSYLHLTKPEIACSLSHYYLWKKLATSPSDCNFLILEDDVVFKEGFVDKWNNEFIANLPLDYYLIFLGGCQPWNKSHYAEVLEPYNTHFNRVKQNDFFTAGTHFWHMNAQSYILSKTGASLLCQWVEQRGFDLQKGQAQDIFIINFFNKNPLFSAPQTIYHLNPLMTYQLHEENNNPEIDKKSDLRHSAEYFIEKTCPLPAFKDKHTQAFYDKYQPHGDEVLDLSRSGELLKEEGVEVCVVSCGGVASNSFAFALETNGVRCWSKEWSAGICHCPHYINLNIPTIYLYGEDIDKAWRSVTRRGSELNQWKLSNSFSTELSDENLLRLMKNQISSWTAAKSENLLVIEHEEIFDASIVPKLEKFLRDNLVIPSNRGLNSYFPLKKQDRKTKNIKTSPSQPPPDDSLAPSPSGALTVIWQIPSGEASCFEGDWLRELFGGCIKEEIQDGEWQNLKDESIIIYSDMFSVDLISSRGSPYPENQQAALRRTHELRSSYFSRVKKLKKCFLIHLSDEFCHADISHYSLFSHVFRNYFRADAQAENVSFLPLGYKIGFNTTPPAQGLTDILPPPFVKKLSNVEIPKIIHLSWKNKNLLSNPALLIQNGVGRLSDLNPDWEIEVSDDEDVERYLRDYLGAEDYQRLRGRKMVEKSDLWRLIKVYKEGGLYMDIDRYCNIPLENIIKPETKCLLPTYFDVDFSQDIVCSVPENPLYKRAIYSNLEGRKAGRSLFYLAVESYMLSLSEVLTGRPVSRNPGLEFWNRVRPQLQCSAALVTAKEEGPFSTILYEHNPSSFLWLDNSNTSDLEKEYITQKALFYKSENVTHWNMDDQIKFSQINENKSS